MNSLGYSVFDKLGPSDEKKQLKNGFKKNHFQWWFRAELARRVGGSESVWGELVGREGAFLHPQNFPTLYAAALWKDQFLGGEFANC